MKILKPTLLLLVLCATLLTSFSCRKKNCDDDTRDRALSYSDSHIGITYYNNANGDFLIKKQGGDYLTSDIVCYDENLQKIPLRYGLKISTSFTEYYQVLIPLFYNSDTQFKFDEEYARRIFIDLKADRDTIDFKFKIKPVGCGSQLEYLEVKYNNIVVSLLNNGWDTEFNINK